MKPYKPFEAFGLCIDSSKHADSRRISIRNLPNVPSLIEKEIRLYVLEDCNDHHREAAIKNIHIRSNDVNNLSYADQNIVMQTLLKRMDRPENTAHLNILGLLDEYTALKNAQMAFEKISAEQTDANSALRQQASASGIRRNLERSLRDLFSLVSAMENVPEWRDLYHDLNELIKEARQSNRTLKKEGGDGDQEGLQP